MEGKHRLVAAAVNHHRADGVSFQHDPEGIVFFLFFLRFEAVGDAIGGVFLQARRHEILHGAVNLEVARDVVVAV